MTQVLNTIDERIETHARLLEQTAQRVRDARALADRLEAERRKAQGRLAQGDPGAPVDLERLRGEILMARREVHAAESARAEAETQVKPLQAQRGKAERAELVGALVPLLDLRAAQVAEIQDLARELVKRIQLYNETTVQTARLSEQLGLQGRPMAVFVARWLMQSMRLGLMAEYPYGSGHREPPLSESDATQTQELRAAIERVAGPEAVAAASSRR